MRRFGLLVLLLLAVPAAPAAASTRVAWGWEASFPPIYGGSDSRYISVVGDSGANHDIVVQPTGAQQLGGFPQKVEIYDYGDTFEVPPPDPYGRRPCGIDSPHHVTCAASGPPVDPPNPYSYISYSAVGISTGDGADRIRISDPLNPIMVQFYTGAGDDDVTINGMWQFPAGGKYGGSGDVLGAGDDIARYGPPSVWAPPYGGDNGMLGGSISGRLISGGEGNDTIESLNGGVDHVSCGDGTDNWQSDPSDDQQTFAYAGPPDTNGDCETRTPPAVADPSSGP